MRDKHDHVTLDLLLAVEAAPTPACQAKRKPGRSAKPDSLSDAEREEIRGAPVHYDPEDSFTTCPELAEQVLVPEDEDGIAEPEQVETESTATDD